MTDRPPTRLTISIPADHDLDLEQIEEIVAATDAGSRSEAIRDVLAEVAEHADADDADDADAGDRVDWMADALDRDRDDDPP
jgi:metal-responsive CopG/Arc/MetJ family transcriptional regulator